MLFVKEDRFFLPSPRAEGLRSLSNIILNLHLQRMLRSHQ